MAARILNDRFLRDILQQVTFAAREFEFVDAFKLIEYDKTAASNIEYNSFTGEPTDPTIVDPVTHHQTTIETTFSAEMERVSEVDYQKGNYGVLPVGTLVIVVNSEELAAKNLTEDRFQSAAGIIITTPNEVDAVGVGTSVEQGFYNITSVMPNYLKNRLMELVVGVQLHSEGNT